MEQGDFGIARGRLREGLLLAQELGDHFTTAAALEEFSQLAALEEHWQLSLQLAAAARTLRHDLGAPLSPADQRRLHRYLARAHRKVGATRAGGPTMATAEAVEAALALTPTDTPSHTIRHDAQVLTGREQAVARLIAQGKVVRLARTRPRCSVDSGFSHWWWSVMQQRLGCQSRGW
jgi:hypothetical protein